MSAPIRVRLSTTERQALADAGPNLSAALRAYLLLGMHAAGVELAPHTRALRALLLADLSPALMAAIERVLGACRTDVGHLSYIVGSAAGDPVELEDPLAFGIEV